MNDAQDQSSPGDFTGEGGGIANAGTPDAETVDDFTVEVQEKDGAHEVVVDADGEQSTVATHSDAESAEQAAQHVEDAATRHEGAAREEEIPDSYPGKGVDETQS